MAASRSASKPPLIVVMGVSGCGKSSVGVGLALHLGIPLVEGDTLHPPANIAKMSGGTPLTDADRWPWLDKIGLDLAEAAGLGQGLVVTCSALRRIYRERLRASVGGRLAFVFLSGSRELLGRRLAVRRNHFMPASLLDSQFATLEDPSGEPLVVRVDIDRPMPDIVAAALHGLEGIGFLGETVHGAAIAEG